MSTLVRLVRRQVSNDKKRYTAGGYDLDLSYITDRIIAMSFPADGVEKMYRNDIDEVSAFLHQMHNRSFMLFNLSERKYDYSKFGNLVTDCGFPDHHSPPLDLLFKICKGIDAHLHCSDQNVAVIHCKAGKGRTGTTIASYLMYCGLFRDAEKALRHFGNRRSTKGIGVTWPSQRRYVYYFHQICYESYVPHPLPLMLHRVMLRNIPLYGTEEQCRPRLEVFCAGKIVYSSAPEDEPFSSIPSYKKADTPSFTLNALLRGDVYIRCYHCSKGKSALFFRVQFHTGFISKENPTFILKKADLDEACKDRKIDDEFAVIFEFKHISAEESPTELVDNFNWNIQIDESRNGTICYFRRSLTSNDFSLESLSDKIKSEVLAQPISLTKASFEKTFSGLVSTYLICIGRVFVGFEDGSLSLFNTDTGAEKTIRAHPIRVSSIARDMQEIFTGSDDGSVKIWDIQTLELVETLEGHTDVVSQLMVHRSFLYSASHDGTVRVWDLTVKQRYIGLIMICSPVLKICINDNVLYVGSTDGNIRTYDLKESDRPLIRNYDKKSDSLQTICVVNDILYFATGSRIFLMNVNTGDCMCQYDFQIPIVSFEVFQALIFVQHFDKIQVVDCRRGVRTSILSIKADNISLHEDHLTISHRHTVASFIIETISGPRLLSSPRNSGASYQAVPPNSLDAPNQNKIFEEYDEDDNDDYETDYGEAFPEYLSSSNEPGSRQSLGEESSEGEKSRRKKASSLQKLTPVKTPRSLSRAPEQGDEVELGTSPKVESTPGKDENTETHVETANDPLNRGTPEPLGIKSNTTLPS